ncbi:hypothetical protein Tco_0776157 [Tanacetum coccineum]
MIISRYPWEWRVFDSYVALLHTSDTSTTYNVLDEVIFGLPRQKSYIEDLKELSQRLKVERWMEKLEEAEVKRRVSIKLVIAITSLSVFLFTYLDLESLPSLHGKVLAAALEAVINISQNQKKKQGVPGALAT